MADFIRAFGLLQQIFDIHLNFFGVFQFSLAEMTAWFFYACLLIGATSNMFGVEGDT